MIDIKEYGFNPENIEIGEGRLPARITAQHKDRFELVCEEGTIFGQLKSSDYFLGLELYPTVGDFVLVDNVGGGMCRIIKTYPRRSYFSRHDPSSSGKSEQAIAANFDWVFVLQSLNQNFNIHRLERYLTLGWQSGAVPVVVLTKSDLCPDPSEMIAQAQASAPGVEVYAISAQNGDGLEALGKYFTPGTTSVFLGSSGVGKSSLVNALAGSEVMYTGEIREDDERGRHTTTHRQLIMLSSGAMIIDTPGMRELGMWDVSEGLGQSFADVEKFFGKCKFRDCTHKSEPGCAVQQAIASGELSKDRWENYRKLNSEAVYGTEQYANNKKQLFKKIAVISKQGKKSGKIKY